MLYEDPHLLALAITAIASISVCAFLNKYLVGILRQYAGNSVRGRFWAAAAQVLIVLIPISVVIALGRVSESERVVISANKIVFELLTRGFLALVGSVLMLVVVIGIFGQTHGTTVFIDAEESDDLTRMLLRIRELRARELIRKIDSENEKIFVGIDLTDDIGSHPRYPKADNDPTNGNF